MSSRPPFPGVRITTNGNHLVSYHTEARITDGGVFYPITPSTEMGEDYQLSCAEGRLNVFGRSRIAIQAEGEHAAHGGAIALSLTGKRVVNFTSGQGVVYGIEQYYHAPGKLSTMVLEVAARALTKHALNVHCGHDDIYAALDTGWIMLFAKDAQQAADQAVILRRVTEQALTPGINIQDGFLTSHLERTFLMCEPELLRQYLGDSEDIIECPTPAQRELFGPTRRRVPRVIDLANAALIGPVQNQEHYMNGVVARRNNFAEPILGFLEDAYDEFARLTGRRYGLVTPYKVDDAEIVFVTLGSAAENIEAAVDHLRATRGARVGSLHINVLRPFPQAAVVEALKGKKTCIVLERTDEPLANDNPLARDVRTALSRSLVHEGLPHRPGLPTLRHNEMPRIFSGVYGLGSRDFRPEHIIGAYEYAAEGRARQDGRSSADGVTWFALGIDHPYAVVADETPSLQPEGSIAVRLHSIGGWGMITTGKNLGEIIGKFGEWISQERNERDSLGLVKEALHISANPKYGSEKKGAPTSYFLVVAPERVRVNCDLHHIDTVLCCDPKIFLHTNPLSGIREGGAFVWESDESPETAWERIPRQYRQEILNKKIRVFILDGFRIAREATDRPELQLRMQGNAFLGAFFRVSDFLEDYGIDESHFREIVRAQYVKKFGRFGDHVVESNMEVMTKGFAQPAEIVYGEIDAPDRSSMKGSPLVPLLGADPDGAHPHTNGDTRAPIFSLEKFDSEFRAGLGYDQPASALASVGVVGAATGATASKYVARRQTPVFIAENCTQCMECIAVCPDTAMPNTAQRVETILDTAVRHYVPGVHDRQALLTAIPAMSDRIRARLSDIVADKGETPFAEIAREVVGEHTEISEDARQAMLTAIELLPIAYAKTHAIFKSIEKKSPGHGGLFSIFISDRCKGCGECVVACGDHEALRMEPDTEALNTKVVAATKFLDLLPDTPREYLGIYDPDHPEDSKAAALRNHLMSRRNYEALVSGDGACAGCGEKSILRAVASVTEAYMRPIYHAKADRLLGVADDLETYGVERLARLAERSPESAERFRTMIAGRLMGLGGETPEDTQARITDHGRLTNEQVIDALTQTLRYDAHLHRDIRAVDGRLDNGMAVMAMGAHTGCNTVYGSTPPNNPHPYPWLNSLFQDGSTVAWLLGEGFILDHARRSVIPERLAMALLSESSGALTEQECFALMHLTDADMTEQEIHELPKVWAIGGDGGMGDIGFQNVSKVVLQNRPNIKVLMLDTQVYSNTGGQNSDSSLSPGGFDMNQFGPASEGKMTEKKSVAEILTCGHGSPFVAQVSVANAAKLYKAMLDGLEYRGTAFFQCFTTCQPEHGVADDMAVVQAKRIRDCRGMPEFVFHSDAGEVFADALDIKGNPDPEHDWWTTSYSGSKDPYRYTPAHWATTEARFRRHLKAIEPEAAASMIPLETILVRVTQADIVRRSHTNPDHRAFVPDFGAFIEADMGGGVRKLFSLSRQMVLFCVERRKAWRLLQSRAGVVNHECRAQQALLARVDAGEIDKAMFLKDTWQLFEQELKQDLDAPT
ncbi:MAG: 2-oxoacid:acceptor oxidoreductase family protein [Phycisphaeraceae bacterium]|nr:2-oxoacid:acceptor oxidoreductase family protein [Phycisphaeraceae bacterium]